MYIIIGLDRMGLKFPVMDEQAMQAKIYRTVGEAVQVAKELTRNSNGSGAAYFAHNLTE